MGTRTDAFLNDLYALYREAKQGERDNRDHKRSRAYIGYSNQVAALGSVLHLYTGAPYAVWGDDPRAQIGYDEVEVD